MGRSIGVKRAKREPTTTLDNEMLLFVLIQEYSMKQAVRGAKSTGPLVVASQRSKAQHTEKMGTSLLKQANQGASFTEKGEERKV